MKRKGALHIVLIVCFCAMLILPLALANFSGGLASSMENRILASFPAYDGNIGAFCAGLESWLNDNVGFRDAASRAVTAMEYHLFRRSAKSTDLIGREDWIFYSGGTVLEDFIGGNDFSQEMTQGFASSMQRVTQALGARGCEALFMLVPDKKSVYPEYYPPGIHPVAKKSRMTALADAMTAQGVKVLNIQPALQKGKELGLVYSQRLDDAHWNALGAFVGYQAVMERLESLGARRITDWTITPYESSGLFNQTIPLTETDYRVHSSAAAGVTDASGELSPLTGLRYNQDPATYQRRYVNQDSSLPRLLFVGDSYMQSSYPYYPLSFSQATYMHFSDISCFWDVVERFSPDVVVFESAERMLHLWYDTLAECAKER